MSLKINLGAWSHVFAVPALIVDKHIKLANSTQIKTLLWILRNSDKTFEIKDIAKALAKDEEDIEDSVQYWIENKVIVKNQETLEPSNEIIKEVNKVNEETLKLKKTPRKLSKREKPDSVYISKRMRESEDITALMQECETILGRPLSTQDCAMILMFMETDGLPADVIVMLFQHAVSIGKQNMRYIEKLAINWAQEEIDSVQKAEAKLKAIAKSEKNWKKIINITGIEYHSQTEKEKMFTNRWLDQWKFSSEMIREAYERCVDSTGKFTFGYTNKILEKWFNNNIKTIKQVYDYQSKRKQSSKKPYKKQEATYDIEEYNKSSIFDIESEKA